MPMQSHKAENASGSQPTQGLNHLQAVPSSLASRPCLSCRCWRGPSRCARAHAGDHPRKTHTHARHARTRTRTHARTHAHVYKHACVHTQCLWIVAFVRTFILALYWRACLFVRLDYCVCIFIMLAFEIWYKNRIELIYFAYVNIYACARRFSNTQINGYTLWSEIDSACGRDVGKFLLYNVNIGTTFKHDRTAPMRI